MTTSGTARSFDSSRNRSLFERVWHSFSRSFPLWLVFSGIAFLLRLPLLSGSFWLDEAAQILESSRPFGEQFQLAADFQPPLYHLWLFVVQQFGHSEAWLRLASVVPGIIVVASFTHLAEKWFSRMAAFWTGALLSTSSLMVFFSQELRPYMFAAAAASVAAVAFFEWVFPVASGDGAGNVSKKAVTPQLRWIWIFTLANAAAMLSSYVAIFLLPAWFLAAAVVNRSTAWNMGKSLLVSCLFFGAWFLGLREQLAVGGALRTTLPGWDQVVSLPQAKAVFLTLGKFVVGRLPLDPTLLDSLLVGIPFLTLVPFVGAALGNFNSEKSKKLWTAVGIFTIPLLLAWGFSFFLPVLEPKRVLYLLPWLFLVVGIVGSQKQWGRMIGVLWLALQLFGLVQYWQSPLLQREPWRSAVQDIERNYQRENTAVIFGFDAPFAPWRWYQTENLSTVSTGLDPLSTEDEARVALSNVEQYENVIVFDYLRDLTDPGREIERVLIQKGFQEVAVWDYPNIGFVRLFYRKALFAQVL